MGIYPTSLLKSCIMATWHRIRMTPVKTILIKFSVPLQLRIFLGVPSTQDCAPSSLGLRFFCSEIYFQKS
ncbi:hypothetical protein CMV_001010 [Castanea mollissima]|uniref:Uncharacterized protein n=1 Tax=Castanea mollissima TaxID=60419 RepID=A0A8J4RWC2_9ROSI|nr:hypothetical protein CMV_001010 [Castanea mollissima]